MRRSTLDRMLPLLFVAASGCSVKDASTSGAADSAEVRASPPATAAVTGSGQSDAGGSTAAPAKPSGAVEYYTAAALAHIGDSLSRGPSTGHMLRGTPTYQYLQIRRARSGVPEVHDRWTDVTVVQSGRATLLSGGRVAGSRDEGSGEHRGGTIVGGSSRPVGSGDLMVIPAGVPHQYIIAAGDSLRYITVKVLARDDAH